MEAMCCDVRSVGGGGGQSVALFIEHQVRKLGERMAGVKLISAFI